MKTRDRSLVWFVGLLLLAPVYVSKHAQGFQGSWLESGLYPASLKSQSAFGSIGAEGTRSKGQKNREDSPVRVFFGLPPYADPGGLGLREGLQEALGSATQSIRAAFFQINDPVFIDSLIGALERGVRVELATDRCYRVKKGYKEQLDRLAAAMDRVGQPSSQHLVDDGTESCDQAFNHNKYAVIDFEKGAGAQTWVGSYNVTAHGAQENFDLAVLVRGEALAEILKRDHEQLMSGAVQVAKKTLLESDGQRVALSDAELSRARAQGEKFDYPSVTVGSGSEEIRMQVLVSPRSKSLRRIIEEVYRAKKEVLFSTFAIGDAMLVSTLINKYGEGVGENLMPVLVRAEPWEKPLLQARKGEEIVPVGDSSQIVSDLFSSLGPEADNYTIGKDPKTAKLKTTFNFVYPAGPAGGSVRKVKMLGIFGNKNVGGSAPWDRLVAAGVPMLRNTANGELHNKLFLIDGETLIVGSHNFSQSADTGNDEVTLIIKSAAMGRFIRDQYLMPTRFFTTPNERVLASPQEKVFHDYRKASVLISEVHATSSADLDAGQYVELYNFGRMPLTLLGFRISTAYFPLSLGEKVRNAQAGGITQELVGYRPPREGQEVGEPLYEPRATVLEPGKFALVVGRKFRTEHYFQRFRSEFQKRNGRLPEEDELPLLLTTGGFASKGVGGARGIEPWSRVTLYGLDGFTVIDRFEYPQPELEAGFSVERVSLSPRTRLESERQLRQMSYTVVTGRTASSQTETQESVSYHGFPSPYLEPQDWREGTDWGGTPGLSWVSSSSRRPASVSESFSGSPAPAPYGIEGRVVDVELGEAQESLITIENGVITSVLRSRSKEAASARRALSTVYLSEGLIYPGLIDTHNHIKYNSLPLWKAPKARYSNRYEWPEESVYTRGVKKVYAEVYRDHPECNGNLECEAQARCTAIRYSEIKALAGGTTAIQGSTSFSDETEDFTFRGLTSRKAESQAAKPEALLSACLEGGARNIERENFGLLDQSRTTSKSIDDDLWGSR
ncbi:MAG: phospholipase D-like domain-containing protein, partial [Oligoflexia bacterium]